MHLSPGSCTSSRSAIWEKIAVTAAARKAAREGVSNVVHLPPPLPVMPPPPLPALPTNPLAELCQAMEEAQAMQDVVLCRQIGLVLIASRWGNKVAAETLNTVPEAVVIARRKFVPLIAAHALKVEPTAESFAAMLELVRIDLPYWTKWRRIDMIQIVAETWGVSIQNILSARRTWDVIKPRQTAAFLCKRFTPSSYPEIGNALGGKDHTTALHSVRLVENLVDIAALQCGDQPAEWASAIAALPAEAWAEARTRARFPAAKGR